MVSLVKDGLLKNLDDYATAFGWDKWPAAQLAQNRVGDGRDPRRRLPVRRGPELQPDRRLLQQEAGGADRHDRAAEDASPSSRTCLPRRRRPSLQPIMQWNAAASGGGLAFPLQQLMAAYGADGADQRLDLPEAGRDHRHADQPRRPPSISSSGSRRATSRRTSTPSSTPTRTPGSARARACSCSTATGRTPCYDKDLRRQRRVLRLPAGRPRAVQSPPCPRR